MKLHVYCETVSHSGNKNLLHIPCDFRLPREVDENSALLGYYAASSKFLTDASGKPKSPILKDQAFTDSYL